jgi:hypothetical protein
VLFHHLGGVKNDNSGRMSTTIGTGPSTKPDGSAMAAGVGCSSLLADAAALVDTFGRAPKGSESEVGEHCDEKLLLI